MDASTTPEEAVIVDHPVVECDGGGGALGHPLVYLNMGDQNEIVCNYCSRKFVLKDGSKGPGSH